MNNNTIKIKVVGVESEGVTINEKLKHFNIKDVDYISVATDEDTFQYSSSTNILLKKEADNTVQIESLFKETDILFISGKLGFEYTNELMLDIAKIAKKKNMITIAFAIEPFGFEGKKVAQKTELGIENLKKYTDSLVDIPLDRLFDLPLPAQLTLDKSLDEVYNILKIYVELIASLTQRRSFSRVEPSELKEILTNFGSTIVGFGVGYGENKIEEASRNFFELGLCGASLENTSQIILEITISDELTSIEYQKIIDILKEKIGEDKIKIINLKINPELKDCIEIRYIAKNLLN